MFVDVVPIKRAALSWMVSSFLSVVGAALMQASGEYSITLVLGQALGRQEVSSSLQYS